MADPMDLTALTTEQRSAMDQLIDRFSSNPEPYVQDEHYLLHWLRAGKFNVDKAENMLRYHLRYRKSLNMDSPEYKANFVINPVMATYYTRGQIGLGKLGHPVAYFPFGGIDSKGILSSVRYSEAMRRIMYWIEQRRWSCQEASEKAGKHISQIIYIIDLKGIGTQHLWKPGIDCFKQLSEAMQQHAPELIYKLFVINAPNLFYTIYKMIKPILDENTQRKINVYGDNFQKALLEEIDASELPVHYGGTLVGPDGDPKCSHEIIYGGQVPVESYFKESDKPAPPDLKEMTVSRASQVQIPLVVENPKTELRWYFKNDAMNDVGFGVYRKLNESQTDVEEMEMVVPYGRLMTFLVPEYGEALLNEPGKYVALLDNSYSWIQSKRVKYSLTLHEAQ